MAQEADDDEETNEYSFGKDYHAEDAYRDLTTRRQPVIDMGRLMAELTIPSAFPPEGYHTGDPLPGNNQSLGSILVNNLASALMFMAFPPGQPILRFEPVEYKLQADIDQDPDLWAETQLALSRLELSHRKRFQATPLMTAYTGYTKAMLIAGNCLWRHIKLNEPTYHLPTEYVVRRSGAGWPLMSILRECVSFMTLDAEHKAQLKEVMDARDYENKKPWEIEVEVYSCLKFKADPSGGNDHSWLYWQESKGVVLEGTEVETDLDAPPMWPGWLIPVYGNDWGRGYCEEYRGDLFTIESLASSLNDGAAAAALSLMFVRPGQTSIKQVREARNLSILSGNAEDVTMFRSEKTGDFGFVDSREEKVAKRLGTAFLLNSSIQRSGERVTAEEWKRMGQELDKAMGGLYTSTAQGSQRIIIVRAVRLHEAEAKQLPKVPTDVINIEVVTGIDALGQTTESQDLEEFAQAGRAAFPKTWETNVDGNNYLTRWAAAKGIKPDGLIKKPQQVQQETAQQQQQAMQQEMLSKGTGPAVKGLADAVSQAQGGGMNADQIASGLQGLQQQQPPQQ
ncbi:portal protein [Rhizobium rhizogenes]